MRLICEKLNMLLRGFVAKKYPCHTLLYGTWVHDQVFPLIMRLRIENRWCNLSLSIVLCVYLLVASLCFCFIFMCFVLFSINDERIHVRACLCRKYKQFLLNHVNGFVGTVVVDNAAASSFKLLSLFLSCLNF